MEAAEAKEEVTLAEAAEPGYLAQAEEKDARASKDASKQTEEDQKEDKDKIEVEILSI
jgi:hypothetical protein